MATWMEDGVASGVASVAIASGQVGPQNANAHVTFMGYTIRETAGAVAVIEVRRDGVVGGTVLAEISLAAAQSMDIWFGPQGIRAGSGLYVNVVSGTVAGSLRYQ